MDGADFIRLMILAGSVLAVLIGMAWLMRRFGWSLHAGEGEPRMTLLETLCIDERTRLAIVRIDERDHVLCISANGTQHLPVLRPAAGEPHLHLVQDGA